MSKKFIASVLFLTLMLPAGTALAQSCFTDTTGHPYEDAICGIKDMGVVEGYSDGSYKPDSTINRAEFTKIVVSINPDMHMGVDPGFSSFSDVGDDDWFYPYVTVAKEFGVIGGYPDGTFKPANLINLAEALKIILETFDAELIPTGGEWYETYIATALDLGILSGIDIDPGIYITRGEMAQMIFLLAYYSLGYDELECADGSCDDTNLTEDNGVEDDYIDDGYTDDYGDTPAGDSPVIPGFEGIYYYPRMCTDEISTVVNPCINEFTGPCTLETDYYAVDIYGSSWTYNSACDWGMYNDEFDPCADTDSCFYYDGIEAVDGELTYWYYENNIWTRRGEYESAPLVD